MTIRFGTSLFLRIESEWESKVKEVESKEEFLSRMERKYHKYLTFIQVDNNHSKKSLSRKTSNDILDPNLYYENSLKGSDIELIFPGHIRSYYASAEF